MNSLDWLATQNGGQFDPVLFGDYRESQDAIIGDGDFNNGFFNDAFPYDMGSPFNLTNFNSPKPQQSPAAASVHLQQSSQPQQTSVSASEALLASMDKQRDGVEDDNGFRPATFGQPITEGGNMLSCNTIWKQLQKNQDFQDGKFDLDSLCSDLRSKARCSESGVVVPADMVDDLFSKMNGSCHTGGPSPLWNKNHVDEAVKRAGRGNNNWGGMGL